MHHLEAATRQAMLATLRSAVAVDDGPTDEQRRLLDVVERHVLDVRDHATTLEPAAAAVALTDPVDRRLVVEALITLELVRHPPSAPLAERVGTYLAALGGADEQVLVRDELADARDQLAEDWTRLREPPASEQGLAGSPEAEVVGRLQTLGACPPGSLGRSFHDFDRRHGVQVAMDHLSLVPHDFAHVLAGYEATPEGELALQAMLVTATAGGSHFSGLLASLLLFEVGMLPFPDIEPKVAVLARPGAAALFAEAASRGAHAGFDFQDVDHLALADRDLVELRAELGIPAPTPGPFTFVC